jgi:hypothetical protein
VLVDKKIKERNILNLFRKRYPDFPKGKIIPAESPDFLLRLSPKKSIGIELSSLPSLSYHFQDKSDLQLLISEIQQVIIKKEEKIRLYRKNMAVEYWLVLHVDSLQAGSFNFNNQLERIDKGNSFEKVFLFDLFEGRTYELL